MIARGDLGVLMTSEKMFSTQKKITKKCRDAKKPVICATQVLETMINNPVPSQAEITDIGNAVLDQFDSLLLSGETTVGKFPVLTVQTMRKIIEDAEAYLFETSDHKNRCPLLGERIKESCAVIRCPDLGLSSVFTVITLRSPFTLFLKKSRISDVFTCSGELFRMKQKKKKIL